MPETNQPLPRQQSAYKLLAHKLAEELAQELAQEESAQRPSSQQQLRHSTSTRQPTQPWRRATALLALIMGLPLAGAADEFADQAPARLQAYLQIDTVNPPGNEVRGVAYLAGLLKAAGIEYQTAESAPGRGNIWARLPGGDAPALILLHHIDVVPADAAYWDVDPLSGIEQDGYLWGRGAIDTKGLGITQLQAFLALHASGKRLSRDVIFMATADEEAGGLYGAGWLIEHHPEIFKNVGFLVNEGGSGRVTDGKPVYRIEVTQKVPLWLRLTATDIPGHGSSPRPTSAVTRILRAGNRIADTSFEWHVVPAVQTMLSEVAEFEDDALRNRFEHINAAVKDAAFMAGLHLQQPGTVALLRNTCSVTSMTGSNKINVVPPTASIELDCRLLPDQDPAAFLAALGHIISDPNISMEQIMGFSPAVSSTATPLYESISRTLTLHYENMKLVPSVSTGFTDSHFFRDMGIVSYGFSPFLFAPDEHTGVHGNNERISVDNMVKGTKVMTDFLFDFTAR
jgi:acetylornithine deacetylase/succinyl-diaminopimelate desuccinylase-like protein